MNIQRSLQSSISDTSKQQLVSIQVPPNRREEILEYLNCLDTNLKNYTTSASSRIF
jgi:hypothetical protein